MRAYPIDSPQAATRLLAMALVADGHFAPCELKTLDRLDASARLGISHQGMKKVIDTFCEDLLEAQRGEWRGTSGLTLQQRERMFNEVRNPRVRAEVRQLCEAIVKSDGHLADGEVELLDAMVRAWRHKPPSVAPTSP